MSTPSSRNDAEAARLDEARSAAERAAAADEETDWLRQTPRIETVQVLGFAVGPREKR